LFAANRRTAFDFKAEGVEGIPDGMTIDIDGNLWIAVFDGSKVIKVDPRKGKKIDQINFPTKNVTSVAFGGENLDILYVTSAKHFLSEEELKAQPTAGALFEVRNLGTKGLAPGFNYRGPF